MKKGVIYKGTNVFGYAGWPSVAKLADGRLAAVFSGDRLAHVCPFGKTMISYSSDEGKTWSVPANVVNTPFDDRDGGICVRGKQVLVTSFNNTLEMQLQNAQQNKKGKMFDLIKAYIDLNEGIDESSVGSCIAVSEDGGNSFPVKYNVPITCPHGPIVLKDGRYFYVGRSFSVPPQEMPAGQKREFLPEGVYYMFSEDGYKWSEPKLIDCSLPDMLFCEPHAIQLNNGEILVQIRVQSRDWKKMYVYQTVSSNNISEWTKAKDIGVVGSPPHLFRHSSGKIVLVYGRREEPYGELAVISSDEGKTWSEPVVIDGEAETGDMGYPCSVELSDGSILTVYYQHEAKGELNKIEYTIWNIPEDK